MRRSRAFFALTLLAALSACGERTDLKPRVVAGNAQPLPSAPYGRPDKPTPAELLKPGVQARPANSIELRIKSEPREDDPFDLPPK